MSLTPCKNYSDFLLVKGMLPRPVSTFLPHAISILNRNIPIEHMMHSAAFLTYVDETNLELAWTT